MNEWAVGVSTSTAARCKYFGETLIFQLVELPYLTFAPRQPSYRVIQPARRPPPKGPTNWMIILDLGFGIGIGIGIGMGPGTATPSRTSLTLGLTGLGRKNIAFSRQSGGRKRFPHFTMQQHQ